MKETKPDMNHDNSKESASRSYLGDKVEHEFSFPRASSSNDVTTPTHRRTNTYDFRKTPSRRPEAGLHISSSSPSTRRSRRDRTPKHYDRLVSHLCEDANESTSASSSSSRDSRDDVHGRLSSAHSVTATSRRTAERGCRRGWPSRRGQCFL
jgi:hypothetical protein